MFGRRNPSSGGRSTPGRSPLSSSAPSAYSEAAASRKPSTTGRNPVAAAARSVAGIFVACFTPPETESAKFSADPADFRASSPAPRRNRSTNRSICANSYNLTQTKESGSLKFTIGEIYDATRHFSPSFKIGQGGFGTVYKGRLNDGTWVAIKRAKKSMYDKHLGVEFQTEIRTLSQVEHLNLVKFYGFLEHDDERIIVVEYVPNGTLREHLDCLNGSVLDLAARLEIAIDVAHAVTYLHMYTDHPIIHRDIKSSNILLTENFRAKVADFGFARLAADSGATHVSTQVKGTAGYLDPEYLRTYQLTEKSDVYSFGVLLVELMTGRRPIEARRELKERITAKWALKKFADGNAMSVLDPKLQMNAANNLALERILELAWQCVGSHRQVRPSMKRCGEILWGIRKDYKEQSNLDILSLSSNSLRTASTKEEND